MPPSRRLCQFKRKSAGETPALPGFCWIHLQLRIWPMFRAARVSNRVPVWISKTYGDPLPYGRGSERRGSAQACDFCSYVPIHTDGSDETLRFSHVSFPSPRGGRQSGAGGKGGPAGRTIAGYGGAQSHILLRQKHFKTLYQCPTTNHRFTGLTDY